jgi:ATP-dependent RNA helicase RhlE
MAGVKSVGFQTTTPVQLETIPEVLRGRDVMGLAQTGTGKTAAFVLPILQHLIEGPHRRVRALIISPTRELAEQTHNAIGDLGGKTRLKSMTIYGGTAMSSQLKKLRAGVEIIVACPGRLLDHVGQGTVNLSSVEIVVLDEADRMLDMGFMPDVRKILKYVSNRKQTLLFSATMPDDVRRLTSRIMRNPVVVQIDHSKPPKTVSHDLYPIEPHLKTSLLISLLRKMETKSVLVFTRTRVRTDRVAAQLKRVGFSVAALQGDMPQGKRHAALTGFREGKYRILVATDIASRGMDVLSISHVINYDMPDTPDAYTHRVGRTGRMTRTGKAFTLVTQDDAPSVQALERVMDVELVCRELDGFDYSAPPPPRRTAPRQGTNKRLRNSGSGNGGRRHNRSKAPGTAGARLDRRAFMDRDAQPCPTS